MNRPEKNHFFNILKLCLINFDSPQKVPNSGQPVSRILSWVRIYLGCLSPNSSCSLPGDRMSRADSFSCLTLHRMGVTCPTLLPAAPVVSYTTFSPLLLRAVCLCGPIRKLTPSQGLPGILLCGVRTFLTVKRAHLADLSKLMIPLTYSKRLMKFWTNARISVK